MVDARCNRKERPYAGHGFTLQASVSSRVPSAILAPGGVLCLLDTRVPIVAERLEEGCELVWVPTRCLILPKQPGLLVGADKLVLLRVLGPVIELEDATAPSCACTRPAA